MNKVFLGQKAPFFRFGALALAFSLLGCLNSSDEPLVIPYPDREEVLLDPQSLEFPDRTVHLFLPSLDTNLPVEGQSGLVQSYGSRVVEEGSGDVVEYRRSYRAYGSWNAERERQYNLFLLRGFFLRPAGLFEDTTGLSTTAALFARAQEHDRFTRYIDSTEAAEYERNLLTTEEPKVVGIQVQTNDAGDTIFLRLVAPESPAWRAGLRRGMALLAINDSLVTGDSAGYRFIRFFDADTAGPIKLTVRAPSAPPFSREVTREKVSFPSVIADKIGSAGYIAIGSFTQTTVGGGSTYTEFRQALQDTRKYAATILDLRGNGGGSLNITLQMCEEVLKTGTLFKVVERRLERDASVRYEVTYKAHAGEGGEGRRFILLADSNSASASELFIAALRENLQAPLVGTRTYGKGVGQAAFTTPGGGYSVVTYGRVLTASGMDYNGVGLSPSHPSTARPGAMLAEAAVLASSQGLAKGASPARLREVSAQAGVLDWNRRQGKRSRVVEIVFPEPALGPRP